VTAFPLPLELIRYRESPAVFILKIRPGKISDRVWNRESKARGNKRRRCAVYNVANVICRSSDAPITVS